MNSIPEIFGTKVFNDAVMKERLPQDTYLSLKKTIEEGKDLDIAVATVVAAAMKDWAVEHGATHYTHWFQPMTGITAEKHDSFIHPQSDGSVIMVFSGKELIKGEPDASSFPSGGLRATFEARGYTAWDPTSFAFIKDDSLCIPTVFCSYSGEVLDKKTPLLRSMELLSGQCVRILRLFGDTETQSVTPTVGAEQEYFLIDKSVYNKRKDIQITGRTLFGAKPPKGQDLEDHYFGVIRPRVAEFMKELDRELWLLGVSAKTKHNEAAPAQHELASVYASANIATDHNQLIMEIMKKVADKHGLHCLLHEKPFEGVNGSGKHNNWSLSAAGENLLEPGKYPAENKRFLLFLCAVLKAVDTHQDLLRISVASPGNDHRLGAHEAPPAIVSVFLGGDMSQVLEAVEKGVGLERIKSEYMATGVHVLPDFKKDKADRNRTSPLAFTGNKFEFRMLGSGMSTADPNVILNTTVADALCSFADRLENAADFNSELDSILRETVKEHKHIIFNGNNYADEWIEEAEERGLLNLRTTVDALMLFDSEKNIELFTKHKIFTEAEIRSRKEIQLENYCKVLNIEALTMIDMVRKDIYPAVQRYISELARTLSAKSALGIETEDDPCLSLVKRLDSLAAKAYLIADRLDSLLTAAKAVKNEEEKGLFFKSEILEAMHELRTVVDEAEEKTDSRLWPYPTYSEILQSV